jgi:hypothetical protein
MPAKKKAAQKAASRGKARKRDVDAGVKTD